MARVVKATFRVRDGRGRFAYTGGRKKRPTKGRRRKVSPDQLTKSAKALDNLEAKSGLKGKRRKKVTSSQVEQAKQVLGGVQSKVVRSSQVNALKSDLGGLPAKTQTPKVTKTPTQTPKVTKTDKGTQAEGLKVREVKPTETPFPTKADGSIRKPATVRDLAKAESIRVTDDGRVRLWEDSPHALKNHKGYKEGVDKSYEYAPVDANGRRRVMPKDSDIKATFEGEVVHHMPKHPDWSKMSDQALVNALADRVSRIETADRGKTSSGAPKVSGDRFEIHHVDQWAKRSFRDINLSLDRGEITLDEAKSQMRALLRPATDSKEGYRIDVRPKGQRELVVLRGKDHVGAAYDLNHPTGIHPDTGKPTKFGIPKDGDSGREWFNGWRDRFWDGYNRVEAYSAAKELERRLQRGGIPVDKARDLWDKALESQSKNYDYIRQWQEAYKNQRKL